MIKENRKHPYWMWSQEGMKKHYLGKWVDKRLYLDILAKKLALDQKLTKYEVKYGEIEEGL